LEAKYGTIAAEKNSVFVKERFKLLITLLCS